MSASSLNATGSANPQSNSEVRMSSDVSSTGSSPQSNPEVQMSNESGSTQSPQSTQSNDKEVTMTTDGSTTSSTPSSAQDGTANGSPSTTAAAGSTPATPAPAKGKEGKKPKYAGKYLGSRPFDRGEEALKASAGINDADVKAERANLDATYKTAGNLRSKVQARVAASQAARAKRDAAIANLKPGLIAAMWMLRVQPNGRAFATGLEGKTDVQTAENLLNRVPGSEHPLTAELLTSIRDAVPPVRAAEEVVVKAEAEEKAAAQEYDVGLKALTTSTALLNNVVKTVKFRSRLGPVPAAVPPAVVMHPAPVDQPVKASVRVAKSHAAHSKQKQD